MEQVMKDSKTVKSKETDSIILRFCNADEVTK